MEHGTFYFHCRCSSSKQGVFVAALKNPVSFTVAPENLDLGSGFGILSRFAPSLRTPWETLN